MERSEQQEQALRVENAIDSLQAIRRDKIESLKQRIRNGTYRVPGEIIADRMLQKGVLL